MKSSKKPGQRIIYAPDSMWLAVKKAALKQRVNVSEYVRRAIARSLGKS